MEAGDPSVSMIFWSSSPLLGEFKRNLPTPSERRLEKKEQRNCSFFSHGSISDLILSTPDASVPSETVPVTGLRLTFHVHVPEDPMSRWQGSMLPPEGTATREAAAARQAHATGNNQWTVFAAGDKWGRLAEPGFDEKVSVLQHLQPINQYQPGNPLNPINAYDPAWFV